MRVTNSIQTGRYLRHSNNALSRVSEISNRIDSQRAFDRISESPIKGVRSLIVRRGLKKLEMYEDNISASNQVFTSAESALMNVTGTIESNVIPKVVSGITGTVNETDRKVIAEELRSLANSMVSDLNLSIAGRRLFGGTNNDTMPFSIENGRVLYNGVDASEAAVQKWYDAAGTELPDGTGAASTKYFFDGEEISAEQAQGEMSSLFPSSNPIYVDIGLGIKYDNYGAVVPLTAMDISINGAKVAGCGSDSDGDSRNIMQLVLDAADAVENNNKTDGQRILDKIHSSHNTVIAGLADIGSKTKLLDASLNRIAGDEINLKQQQNDAEAVDMTEELIDYEASMAAYNAILQMGSKVIPNSIFNFI